MPIGVIVHNDRDTHLVQQVAIVSGNPTFEQLLSVAKEIEDSSPDQQITMLLMLPQDLTEQQLDILHSQEHFYLSGVSAEAFFEFMTALSKLLLCDTQEDMLSSTVLYHWKGPEPVFYQSQG